MEPMSSRTRIIIALGAIGCVIALCLLLIFNDTIRGAVLDPIVEGINAFRYILGYFPQDVEWLVVLLVVFVIVLGIFATRLPKRADPVHTPFVPPFPKEGPSMKLTQILEKSARNKFRRERVILELRDLAARTLAYHTGISIEEAKGSLDTTEWTETASVRNFLSLDKHRAGKIDPSQFHDQVDAALAHIEHMYQEV